MPLPVAAPVADEAGSRRYYLSPEEVRRQELQATARIEQAQHVASLKAQLEAETTRRAED